MKLCPAATIYDDANQLYHVVTIDSPLPNGKYQAKNTFKNNKKIILSHDSNDKNCVCDAIIIRFYLDSSHPLYSIKNKN